MACADYNEVHEFVNWQVDFTLPGSEGEARAGVAGGQECGSEGVLFRFLTDSFSTSVEKPLDN